MLNQLDRENIDKAIVRIINNIKEALPKIDKPMNVRIEELKKISTNITITESKMLLSDICVSLRKETLKKEIRKEVEALYRGNFDKMDAFSKSIVSPVFSDLATYSTDLAMKKVTQKGAWEDSEKVYSLLAVDRNEVITITDKVFRNFVDNASKNLGNSTK